MEYKNFQIVKICHKTGKTEKWFCLVPFLYTQSNNCKDSCVIYCTFLCMIFNGTVRQNMPNQQV